MIHKMQLMCRARIFLRRSAMPAPTLEPMENRNGTIAPALEESAGAAIRGLRLREGQTIAQVSEQAGISRGMLSKIETGGTMARLDTRARIACTLGVAM